ncbi:hypothetical protein [Enemella sp. A6]|uniref:hypothetical protein n=1 Tax=Enemella sp. A6 TaxID=3440152 RepID=UPI003EBAE05B
MFSEDFIRFLESRAARKLLPESVLFYRTKFKELGFDEANSDFVRFWSEYGDEYYGEEGFIFAFMYELEDINDSLTAHLRETLNLPRHYFPLFNLEAEDYLFYNKNDDSVALVASENIDSFIESGHADQRWSSFKDFIHHHLGYENH